MLYNPGMSILLQVNNLEMAYGNQQVLRGATFAVADRQKIAVVGRNGAGKSTLFKLIVGEEESTGGEILIPKTTRLGYLTQHSNFQPGEKVMDYLMSFSGKEDWECAKVAAQFQLKNELLEKEILALSGGFQMRVKLSAILARDPNLLLLDEPTNYLDLSTQLLLENFLKKYQGAFLLISHDREFIRSTCDQTLEIEHGKTVLFPQTLEEYLRHKATKLESVLKTNLKIEQEKERLQSFIDRFGAKASKASQAKSKQKQIEKLQTVEVASSLATARIKMPKLLPKKGVALKVDSLAIGYPERKVAELINFEIERGERIAVVGDNGQGKTTLLKTLAGELAHLNGELKWGHQIEFGYYAQHTPATLRSDLTVLEYLKRAADPEVGEEGVLKMAGNFLFTDQALKKRIEVLSGGEKARLCLATMLLQKNEVLLLDEPTNHLDFETVESLARGLADSLVTVIFVSHNRSFVELLANGIIEVNNGKVIRYLSDYSDYVEKLERRLEMEVLEQKAVSKVSEVANEEMAAAEKRTLAKPLKNRLNKLDSQIVSLEQEKQQLNLWFEQNPTVYDDLKSKRFAEIVDLLNAAENEWLQIQEQLEGLK